MIKLLNVPSFRELLDAVATFCAENKGQEIDVVVPDKLSLYMEKYLFEKLNISASFNIHVNTLNRYAKKNCNIAKENQISKTGSIICINKLLNEHLNEFKVMINQAYSFSYAENIFATISQLKASKITYDEMMNFKSQNLALQDKIQDLALIYKLYEEEKAGLLDATDEFMLSTMFVAQGKQNRKIVFAGFDDFTAIQYSIIERLALVADVYVMNYSSKGCNKRIFNKEVEEQLKNIAYTNEIGFEFQEVESNSSGLKSFLQNNLMGDTQDSFTLDYETIKIMSGNSVDQEIEFVARDIRSRIIEGGKYKDFGVAVFGLDSCVEKINKNFSKYNINYYIDSQIAMSNSVFYKFLMSVLKYNLEGYSLTNLIDIINSPFLEMDFHIKSKIVDKLLTVNYQGERVFDIDFEQDLSKDIAQIKEFVELFVFEKSDNINDFINLLSKANVEINFEEKLDTLASEMNVEEQILLQKSKSNMDSILSDISRFYPLADMRIVYDVLSSVADVVKVNNLPAGLDCVKIVDANNSMELFDKLYIIGCDNIQAPNVKNDCGIILDKEIEKLNFAHKLSPTIAHINRLSKLRLFNLILSFNLDLTITYSGMKSEVILDLMKKIKIQDNYIDAVPISILLENNIALSKQDYIEKIYHSKKNLSNIDVDGEKLIKNKDFSQISKENLKIFENLKTISASQLESYFTCPFNSFLNYFLKIKPRIDSEIQAMDVGTILHEIIDKYYKANKQVGDVYQFVKGEIYSYIEREERLKFNANSPIIKNLIDESLRVLSGLNYIDENSNFQPILFEQEFRNETALKLKNIDLLGKIDRVDKADNMLRIVDYKSGKADASLKELYYGCKLQLFLYSCAIEEMKKQKVVGCFYLPLHNKYSSEVENSYALKGFFFNDENVVMNMDKRLCPGDKSDIVNIKMSKSGVANKTIGNKELNFEDFEKLKYYSKLVSEKAVEEMKSGYICPSPTSVKKACDYCPFVQVCMRESNQIGCRGMQSVKLDSFKEVDE